MGRPVTDLPRILIVKYLPDSFRDEPRNVGVALWMPGAVAARFLGEDPDAPGDLIDADIPAFVGSPAAYKVWVRYWRREIGKGSDLAAIREGGVSNFRIADAGTLPEPLTPAEVPGAIKSLFGQHVTASPPRDRRAGPPVGERTPQPAKDVGALSQREMVRRALDAEGDVGPGQLQRYILDTFGVEVRKVVISSCKSQLKAKKTDGTGHGRGAPGTGGKSVDFHDLEVVQELMRRLGPEQVLLLIRHAQSLS